MGKMLILKAMAYTPSQPGSNSENNGDENETSQNPNQPGQPQNPGNNTGDEGDENQNQGGNENQGGGNNENQGGDNNDTPSQPDLPPVLSFMYSPKYIDLNRSDHRAPLAYTAPGHGDYANACVGAVDVSSIRGKRISITHTTSNDDGYAFLSDTGELGSYDVANIENWDLSTSTAWVGSFRAILFSSYQLGFGQFESTTQEFTVPQGAKWFIFGTKNPETSNISVLGD